MHETITNEMHLIIFATTAVSHRRLKLPLFPMFPMFFVFRLVSWIRSSSLVKRRVLVILVTRRGWKEMHTFLKVRSHQMRNYFFA